MGRVEKQTPRSSRSRPISCKFCRTRKLRCSRQFPCNNCTSRGLRCQQEEYPTPSVSNGNGASPEPPKFQEDVLARLAKLEEIVLGKQENSVQGRNFSYRAWQEGYPESHTEKSGTIDVDWLDGDVTYSASAVSLPLEMIRPPANLVVEFASYIRAGDPNMFHQGSWKCPYD